MAATLPAIAPNASLTSWSEFREVASFVCRDVRRVLPELWGSPGSFWECVGATLYHLGQAGRVLGLALYWLVRETAQSLWYRWLLGHRAGNAGTRHEIQFADLRWIRITSAAAGFRELAASGRNPGAAGRASIAIHLLHGNAGYAMFSLRDRAGRSRETLFWNDGVLTDGARTTGPVSPDLRGAVHALALHLGDEAADDLAYLFEPYAE